MASESQFLRTIIPLLPTEIASKLRSLCASSPTNESTLENLIRFIAGGEASADSSTGIKDQWAEKQVALRPILSSLVPTSASGDKKRRREEEEGPMADTDSQQSKKPRIADGKGATTPMEPGAPLFTLHSLSVTSPVRKKVDITIHENAVVMTNPSSKAVEATIPTSFLRRAFILPTRGKTKPHWTVVVLSADVPDAKGKAAAPNGAASENQQIIFGIDATTTTNFITTTYTSSQAVSETQPKGIQTLPLLRQFLSHLPTHAQPILEPAEQAVFKSACPGIMGNATSSSSNGIPGAEAYRGAKAGNLWFAKEGVLWGESKPCEFWGVEDLDGREGGLRIQGAGRTCSVILIRKPTRAIDDSEGSMQVDAGGDVDGEERDEPGDETEFGMVDAKEREGIQEWVRQHRRLFWMPSSSSSSAKGKGKEKESDTHAHSAQKPVMLNTGPMTIHTLQDLSDDEDDDFDVDVSDLDGSEHSSQESSSSDEEEAGEGGAEGEEEEEAEGSGGEDGEGAGGVDADAPDADDVEDEDELGEGEDDEADLDPARHPLLRPGAMPRMSKAALQMAVGIVEDACMGTGGGEEGDEDEEDELDD